MHEYGLMQDVVKVALESCRKERGRHAVRVRIEVGEFAVASRESLETAYEVLTRGTPLEGSSLEVAEVPGHAMCEACGFAGSAADLGDEISEPPALLLCPRCGYPVRVTAGAGIAVINVQLEDRGHLEAGEPVRGGR